MKERSIRLQEEFFWKFSTMIDAGMPILNALSTLKDEFADEDLGHIIAEMIDKIASGETMHGSMDTGAFSPYAREMVRFGEEKGVLNEVLKLIVKGLESGRS